MIPSGDLRAQILHAMRRLESRGEVSVSPMRIADLIEPRPSLGAMVHALGVLWEEGVVNDGRVGDGRYTLAQRTDVPEPEPMRLDVGA